MYVEYGKICTRYSFQESSPDPKYGNDPIIILPFNWGDEYPEEIYTEDGEQYFTKEDYGFRKSSFSLYPAYQPLVKEKDNLIKGVNNTSRQILANIRDMNVYLAHQLLMHLYNEESDQNILFSPISLQIVLSLVYEGAEDKTKEELKTVTLRTTLPVSLSKILTS